MLPPWMERVKQAVRMLAEGGGRTERTSWPLFTTVPLWRQTCAVAAAVLEPTRDLFQIRCCHDWEAFQAIVPVLNRPRRHSSRIRWEALVAQRPQMMASRVDNICWEIPSAVLYV